MHATRDIAQQTDLRSHLEAVIVLMDQPAALILGDDEILAFNHSWQAAIQNASGPAHPHPSEHNTTAPDSIARLPRRMRERAESGGVIPWQPNPERNTRLRPNRGYRVDWKEFHTRGASRQLSLVFLREIGADCTSRDADQSSKDALISHLLIRQTLIEESERRRLGQFLHDVVAQDLALIRQMLVAITPGTILPPESVSIIDRAINNMRTLTVELSLPVLEDLGFYGAMHWLAEHLGQRYGTHIEVVDDGASPEFTIETRTIVFRGIRELVVNACKHAHGSEIVVSSMATPQGHRFTVRDTGPGFEPERPHLSKEGIPCFGLASIEQQLIGIGVRFEIDSAPGDGTGATIIVPTERK
jgi:signal transduction histidine kinase